MVIDRNAANIVRTRLRATKGRHAVITRGATTLNAGCTVSLGRGDNIADADRMVTIEADRKDVFVKASDYGVDPELDDRIVVTLLDGSLLHLGVYVPNTSDQCFQNSDPEGVELRVYCRTRS